MLRQGITRRTLMAALASAAFPLPSEAEEGVDLALVLAIDCSLSIDDFAYRIQLRGTGQAIIDSGMVQVIGQGREQAIAVAAFLWSSPDSQQVIVPWRILRNGGDAYHLTDEIFAAQRRIPSGATATGNALQFASTLLQSAPAAARRVIDVSTNGHANMGIAAPPVRDELVAQGIIINGLAVTDREPALAEYLRRDVIGGRESFVITANDYNAYTLAIRKKLFREISNNTSA